jgi:hypothetical protein
MSDTSVEFQPAPERKPAPSPESEAIAPATPGEAATSPEAAEKLAAHEAPSGDGADSEPGEADAARSARGDRAAPPRPAFGFPHVSSSEIRAELRRREARVSKLLAERAELLDEMQRLEAELRSQRED